MAKRKVRTKIKILHDKAWVALSKYKRRLGICQRCGKQKEPKDLDAHHLVKKARGNYAKFEPDNIVALCGWYCHRNWWHGQAEWDEQLELIERWIGLERYEEIKREANNTHKYSVEDYEEMIEMYKERL